LGNLFVFAIWAVGLGLSVLGMFNYVFHRKPPGDVRAEGKTMCIIPVYNEDPALLDGCIQSLLLQTAPIDKIFVVDDGSKVPVNIDTSSEKIELVRLEKNRGKHIAQAIVLKAIGPDEYTFLLTVDSDSILAPTVVDYFLKEMHDPRVKACTATVFASNYSQNFLTKVQDFDYGFSTSIARSAQRALGLLDTTTGACAFYRTAVLNFHLDDYLRHTEKHPYADDRRMALYSLMEGIGRYVPEAVVYTEVPENLKVLWRQRVRWAQSLWSDFPYYVVNLGFKRSIFLIQSVLISAVFPIIILMLLYFSMLLDTAFWLYTYIGFVIVTTYVAALFYTVSRYEVISVNDVFGFGPNKKRIRGKRRRSFEHRLVLLRRLIDWVIISPFYVIFTHFFLIPVLYVALFKVLRGSKTWGTR